MGEMFKVHSCGKAGGNCGVNEMLMRVSVADVLYSARIRSFYLILEAISLFTQCPLFY